MSGRIRTIKPEWLEDELIASEPDHVRLLTIGLILLADDHGCGRAAVNFIASEVWKYDRSPEVLTKVREGLQRLSGGGQNNPIRFVRLYEVDGQAYFEIRSWAKHQRVQHVGARRVPAPPPEQTKEPPKSKGKRQRNPREGLTKIPETLTPSQENLTPDLRSPISDLTEGSPNTGDVGQADEPVPVDGSRASVQAVWDAYIAGWHKHIGKGIEPKLTDARRAKIRARLKDHGAEVVVSAASGVWASSWHVENGFTEIDLVMRDAEHVERFAKGPSQARPRQGPPVQRTPGYQAIEERKRAEAIAEAERRVADMPPAADGGVF